MNALKGLHVGGIPPLEYDVDKETMKFILNEREAEVVRIIFRMALEDKSYKEIADYLRMRGYKSKRGYDFGINSMHDILKNEKYTGTYIYSKAASKNLAGKYNRHAYKDEEDIVRLENGCPTIISKEDFERVQ